MMPSSWAETITTLAALAFAESYRSDEPDHRWEAAPDPRSDVAKDGRWHIPSGMWGGFEKEDFVPSPEEFSGHNSKSDGSSNGGVCETDDVSTFTRASYMYAAFDVIDPKNYGVCFEYGVDGEESRLSTSGGTVWYNYPIDLTVGCKVKTLSNPSFNGMGTWDVSCRGRSVQQGDLKIENGGAVLRVKLDERSHVGQDDYYNRYHCEWARLTIGFHSKEGQQEEVVSVVCDDEASMPESLMQKPVLGVSERATSCLGIFYGSHTYQELEVGRAVCIKDDAPPPRPYELFDWKRYDQCSQSLDYFESIVNGAPGVMLEVSTGGGTYAFGKYHYSPHGPKWECQVRCLSKSGCSATVVWQAFSDCSYGEKMTEGVIDIKNVENDNVTKIRPELGDIRCWGQARWPQAMMLGFGSDRGKEDAVSVVCDG